MRVTERDIRLVRDITLSHAMARDHVIGLGYFGSVTRANTRLRELSEAKLVRPIDTPFFSQRIYVPGARAKDVVGERIAAYMGPRSETPRFLRHAVCTASVRVRFRSIEPNSRWAFEQQCRVRFGFMGADLDVRPDGLVISENGVTAIETDLGNTPIPKFAERLRAYRSLAHSGGSLRAWGFPTFTLLVVTTGPLRARRISRLATGEPGFALRCEAHDRLGIPFPGSWS